MQTVPYCDKMEGKLPSAQLVLASLSLAFCSNRYSKHFGFYRTEDNNFRSMLNFSRRCHPKGHRHKVTRWDAPTASEADHIGVASLVSGRIPLVIYAFNSPNRGSVTPS